jgi:hypothetical protein
MKHLIRFESYSEQDRLNDILAKILKYGEGSLTDLEKRFLQSWSTNTEKQVHDEIGKIDQDQLAGAKLLIVGGDKFTERPQPAMNETTSSNFKTMLIETTEGMARQVFVAQISNHCEAEREQGSCKLHLTKAVSYVG